MGAILKMAVAGLLLFMLAQMFFVSAQNFAAIPPAQAAEHSPPPELFEPLTKRDYVRLTISLCHAHHAGDSDEFIICVRESITKWLWRDSEAYHG